MKRLLLIVCALLLSGTLIAQNTRLIKGIVRAKDGTPLKGAIIKSSSDDVSVTAAEGGAFEIKVSPYTTYLEVTMDKYIPARAEIDGSYVFVYLKFDKQYAYAVALAEAQKIAAAQKEAVAKAKAEEQERIAAQKNAEKEAETKAKAEEQARLIAQKEAAAKAKVEEQERIAAQKNAEKEAETKAKAEEQARLTAQREAESQAKLLAQQAETALKNEAKVKKCIESNLRYWRNLQIPAPADSYAALGDRYLHGKGVPFNQVNAFWCYNKGAEVGEALAYMRLALFYETGREYEQLYIEKDIKIAVMLYEKAASLGLTDAEAGAARLRAQK